jgi:hypothetical protein
LSTLVFWKIHAQRPCREAGEITIFALQPAGVPSGTVRSLIALLVIFASIGFAAFTLIQG